MLLLSNPFRRMHQSWYGNRGNKIEYMFIVLEYAIQSTKGYAGIKLHA